MMNRNLLIQLTLLRLESKNRAFLFTSTCTLAIMFLVLQQVRPLACISVLAISIILLFLNDAALLYLLSFTLSLPVFASFFSGSDLLLMLLMAIASFGIVMITPLQHGKLVIVSLFFLAQYFAQDYLFALVGYFAWFAACQKAFVWITSLSGTTVNSTAHTQPTTVAFFRLFEGSRC
jgi:hypothetical protein